jgi:hypothetical protein
LPRQPHLLFSANVADRFREVYEAEAGRKVDPWWDVHSLLSAAVLRTRVEEIPPDPDVGDPAGWEGPLLDPPPTWSFHVASLRAAMPSFDHEFLVDLFRNNAKLAVELLRTCAGIAVDHARVEMRSIDLSQIAPAEYRADAVISCMATPINR